MIRGLRLNVLFLVLGVAMSVWVIVSTEWLEARQGTALHSFVFVSLRHKLEEFGCFHGSLNVAGCGHASPNVGRHIRPPQTVHER